MREREWERERMREREKYEGKKYTHFDLEKVIALLSVKA